MHRALGAQGHNAKAKGDAALDHLRGGGTKVGMLQTWTSAYRVCPVLERQASSKDKHGPERNCTVQHYQGIN